MAARSLGFYQTTAGQLATKKTLAEIAGSGGIPAKATSVLIGVEGSAVRFRSDGSNAQAGVGHKLAVGSFQQITGPLEKVSLCGTDASTVVSIEFFAS